MSGTAADLVTPTPPNVCALALAVPLTWEDFRTDLETNVALDFSRQELLRGRTRDAAWAEDGAPLADLCRAVCDEAAALGVTVVRNATLDVLPALFDRCEVITLVAHWRDANLRGDDFLVDPSDFAMRVRTGADELSRVLAARLNGRELSAALSRTERQSRARAMAELIDKAVINSDQPFPGCLPPGRVLIDLPSLQARHRDMLDSTFPEMLRPGNRIELRDGLHGLQAIAAAARSGWAGIIDLAICQSVHAAHAIKNGRTEVRVIFNKNPVVLPVRIRMILELYVRLAEGGRNYAKELTRMVYQLRELGQPR